MTPGQRPRVHEVALDQPAVPTDLEPPAGDSGQVVVLLADEASREDGWSGRFAHALAARWSRPERRVVLADADLAQGSLHDVVGVPNDEGLGDLLRYGASPARVTRPLGETGPSLISSGTAVFDPDEALRDSRLTFLLDEFRGGGSTLLLYLPAGSSRAAALADEADIVIRMVLGPLEGEPAPGAVWIHAVKPEPGPASSFSADPVALAGEATAGATPARPHGPPRRRRRILAVVLLLIVLAATYWTYWMAGPG